ncbi:MAG: 30S ribosome-binding factor RbfA [Acidobacteria bacterium]|nr:30S ribosome-binding factor RbfA [Acidobacteriota bacterium]
MTTFRPERVGDQLRSELSELLSREVHDPGVGFITLTRVRVTPDLQLARVYYTSLGNEVARRNTERALQRVTPFLRHELGRRLRLRRVPELHFLFDKSVEGQARIEQVLEEIHAADAERHSSTGSEGPEQDEGRKDDPADDSDDADRADRRAE